MKFPTLVGPDQYYAFTSRLTARGMRRPAMLVIACFTVSLCVPAVLAMFNPQSTYLPGGRLILVGAAVVCVIFALPWLRHRWPTRVESTALMAVGAVALAVGCVVAADPLAGLLIGAAFPFILGYAALFHSTRLLAFTMAVAASTYLWLAVRIGADDIPTAFAVTTPLVLLNIVVVFAGRTVALVGESDQVLTDVEPLTGLPARGAFYEGAANLMSSRARSDDRFLLSWSSALTAMPRSSASRVIAAPAKPGFGPRRRCWRPSGTTRCWDTWTIPSSSSPTPSPRRTRHRWSTARLAPSPRPRVV